MLRAACTPPRRLSGSEQKAAIVQVSKYNQRTYTSPSKTPPTVFIQAASPNLQSPDRLAFREREHSVHLVGQTHKPEQSFPPSPGSQSSRLSSTQMRPAGHLSPRLPAQGTMGTQIPVDGQRSLVQFSPRPTTWLERGFHWPSSSRGCFDRTGRVASHAAASLARIVDAGVVRRAVRVWRGQPEAAAGGIGWRWGSIKRVQDSPC